VSSDKSKPVEAKPTAYPSTLGEFVGLGWRMQGLYVPSNGTDKFAIYMDAAAKALGNAYPTGDFMLAQMCHRCGQKHSLRDWSLKPAGARSRMVAREMTSRLSTVALVTPGSPHPADVVACPLISPQPERRPGCLVTRIAASSAEARDEFGTATVRNLPVCGRRLDLIPCLFLKPSFCRSRLPSLPRGPKLPRFISRQLRCVETEETGTMVELAIQIRRRTPRSKQSWQPYEPTWRPAAQSGPST
jgi:hypothetical protein